VVVVTLDEEVAADVEDWRDPVAASLSASA
jgi:hypothetical protein